MVVQPTVVRRILFGMQNTKSNKQQFNFASISSLPISFFESSDMQQTKEETPPNWFFFISRKCDVITGEREKAESA